MARALQAIGYLLLYLAVLAAVYLWATRLRPVDPVTAGDGPEVTVIAASEPVPFATPGKGWFHWKFLTRRPMQVDRVEKEGRLAIRCTTDGSGSIFGRFARVDTERFPILAWSWLVEKPVESEIDERTVEGDDHPARLFIRFRDEEGGRHDMEIIWANKHFQPGDYKILHDFPHYVAQTGTGEVGQWVGEEVDLLEIYRKISERGDRPHTEIIALFCDTDDTGTSSVAYFGDIALRKRGP